MKNHVAIAHVKALELNNQINKVLQIAKNMKKRNNASGVLLAMRIYHHKMEQARTGRI